MNDIITEALLEIHFHRAIVDYFTTIYGANFLRLLKPSPQQEAWVGFDQGWVRTSVTTGELLDHLKDAIQSNATSAKHFYFGYFLQFKKVQRVTRKSRHFPQGYSIPYLRSELSLVPNRNTGLSQHETLLRLNGIRFASVSYACAMFFDLDEIYQEPDLELLRCVDLSTAPTGWATNEPHFITFRSETDLSPLWCSQPVEGKAISFREWVSPDSKIGPKKMTAQEISRLIETVSDKITGASGKREPPLFKQKTRVRSQFLPESFTIMEFVERSTFLGKPLRRIITGGHETHE
ncbi:MAG: hypothetical protein ABSH06_27175 [Thermodesulfobacteriota bacterium]